MYNKPPKPSGNQPPYQPPNPYQDQELMGTGSPGLESKPIPRKRRTSPSTSTQRHRRKNPNPGPAPNIFKEAMKKGVQGAKQDIAGVLEQTTRNVITQLATTAINKGVSGLMNIRGAQVGELEGGGTDGGGDTGETAWPDYLERIIAGEYGLILISGARDSGKTTAAVSAAEHRQKRLGQNIYFLNYPAELAPQHILSVDANYLEPLLAQAEFGSTIVADDASLLINSKRTMTGKGIAFESLVNTIAHRGILLIVTVQDTSDVNKAGLRADAYLMKPPERMFLETERPRMRIIQTRALEAFQSVPQDQWIKYIYAFVDSNREGMVRIKRPAWMDRAHAKYRRVLGTGPGQGAGPGANSNSKALVAPQQQGRGQYSSSSPNSQQQSQGYIEGEYRELGGRGGESDDYGDALSIV